MIRKLQIKFIAIAMGVLIIVFSIVLFTINIFMKRYSNEMTGSLLEQVAHNDGYLLPFDMFSGEYGAQQPGKIRNNQYFYAKLNVNNDILSVGAGFTTNITVEGLQSYVTKALEKRSDKGRIDNYSFLIAEKAYGSIIVFVENSIEILLLEQLLRISTMTAALCFIALFILVIILSKWAINPVKTAFEKQRRFISDAGHELKTPLTVISANADVLEGDVGENIWLTHIKEQTMRMAYLVNDLLTLARTDEDAAEREQVKAKTMTRLDLSAIALNTSLEFESKAFEEGKQMDYDIKPDISINGNEQEIKKLLSILVDNAIMHSADNGEIKINLFKEKDKTIFSVYNTGEGIDESEREKIFERFYRSDTSRSRDTGGFGLGLSIAKAIAEEHGGNISVASEKGSWIRFTITF